MSLKKVLHITTYFPPHFGGLERVAEDIVNSLKDGYEHFVIAFNHEDGEYTEKNGHVTVFRCKTNIKISSQVISFSYGKKLKKIFEDFKPDIIHFHFPNPFGAHYLLKLIKHSDVKLIVHYHSDIIKQKILKKLFIGQTQRLLQRANAIVATSPQYIDHSEFLPKYKEKCVMIPNCVNTDRFIMSENDLSVANSIRNGYNDKTICLFVGRHVPYKGLEKLIAASKQLDSNIVVRIAGQGDLTEQLKSQSKGATNIEFIGAVPNLNPELYACDIFTFPSITKNEAFGIALAEAMWFAKPAVTFHIEGSGVNYVGLKDETCLECENGNVDQLANAINTLSRNRSLRERLGNNAKKRVGELFTFDTFQSSIISLYGQL